MGNENKAKRAKGPFGGGPIGKVEKPKDFKGTFKKLFSYLGKYKIVLVVVVIFAMASTVFSIVGPRILGDATTEIFNGLVSKVSGGSGIDFGKIEKILLTLLVIYIVSAIFAYIQGLIMTHITQRTTYRMRKELVEKINRLPMNYFDKNTHGEVLSVITNDVDTLSQSLNQSAAQLITSITSIIGVIIMMLTIDWMMTLITVMILPISLVFVMQIVKRSQKFFLKQQEYLGHVNGQVEEMFSGHTVVKAFNAEKRVISNFEKDNKTLYTTAWKSQFLSGLMQPIMAFIGNAGYVLVAVVGAYFTVIGRITVGNIQSFIQYVRNFTHPIAQLAQVSNMLQSMMAASERIFKFLEQEEEIQIVESPLSIDNVKGDVEFKNVKFGYKKDNLIIKNFSIGVKRGEKIAIVGPTGAGKTTIVKLLMRFYDVKDGEILLDGNNINDFNRRDLRKVFGMVLQDTWLFNRTIMENLRYGRLDASDEEVINAAKTAHVHHFIQTLPECYNMIINEESNNISGGQKQLLTIARAILADPKVLILDEATSSVDTRTEILIQKAMDELMKGRTNFIIAHRLSTIKNADKILVMNGGDIVEIGNHEELLDKNGFYTKLYNSQFENSESA